MITNFFKKIFCRRRIDNLLAEDILRLVNNIDARCAIYGYRKNRCAKCPIDTECSNLLRSMHLLDVKFIELAVKKQQKSGIQ
jgi:hypothetical protein